MNALMTIQIRVLSAQARRELAQTQGQVKMLEAQTRAAGRAGTAMSYGLPQLSKWGNQVQWAGRQLQYNFTLPLLIAAGVATKFQLDNEKAMTRVEKVYGDAAHGAEELRDEVDALGRSFEALSNKYGVQQSAVIDLAADWAAAGASGLALAKSVDLTLQTMILGELEAAEATEALIAIQAQYGHNTAQLTKTIETLNMVENQTGITMKGLIQGFSRAAGVARSAGVDVQHLAAMLAALTPASGSATNAGNALKTMISRLLSPTKEASQVLGLMGIQMDDVNWKSLTAAQRLELMAEKYNDLGKGVDRSSRALDVNGKATGRMISSQQAIVSTVVASRWQINRWDVLMRDVFRRHGYYQKSLRATSDEVANFDQKVEELNAVLNSNPQRLKQMWVIMQNAMTDVIQPMIPYIVWLASEIAQLLQGFANLNPVVQKSVLVALLFLAAIGPVARYIGSVATLFGILSAAAHFFAVKLGLTTVAVMAANGQIAMQRTGLAGLIGRWLTLAALPFRKIAAGMGAVFTGAMFKKQPKAPSPGGDDSESRRQVDNLRKIWYLGLVKIRSIWAAGLGSIATLYRAFWPMMFALTLGGGGMLGAAFGTMWAGITRANTTGQALNLSRFVAWLGSMRIAQYVWTTSMVQAMTASMLKIGAAMSLLGAFAASAVQGLWVFLTVPGMISGNFLRIWGGMTLAAATRWTQFTLFLRMTWAKFLVAWGGMTAAAAVKIRAIWAVLHASMLAISVRTYMALLALPGRFLAGTAAAFKALPALFARIGPAILTGLRALGPVLATAFKSPFLYAAAAALAVVYTFREQIAQVWNQIVSYFRGNSTALTTAFQPLVQGFWNIVGSLRDAFWSLPAGVRDAMIAVAEVVRAAAMEVYSWFSWMNPWQRHSPSLVESVQTGMAAIRSAYASAGNVGSIFKKAAADLAAFKKISSSMGAGEWQDERKDVKKAFPSALPVFDALVGDLQALNGVLANQAAAVSRQEVVVDRWSKKLDKANNAVDRQENKLGRLRDRLNTLQEAYSAHEAALDAYASAPIKGMGRMEDKIFANEMAQKKLRLEMLKFEQANGSIDDMRSRLASLMGDIETMRGKAADLREAGAGSEILGPIEDQIRAMEAQARALQKGADSAPIQKMQDELDKLAREGEILDLEKAIKYDPMLREIDKLANAQKELSFDAIINGIERERAAMERLQPKIDAATDAIERQEQVVKEAEKARDSIQNAYDREGAKLDALNEKYRETESLIRDIESALRDMGSVSAEAVRIKEAKEAKKKKPAEEYLSPGAQNFLDAAGGGFPDPGSQSRIGREPVPGRKLWDSQADLIDEFTKQTAADVGSMFGKIDMFGPLKKAWTRTWEWIKSNAGPVVEPVAAGVRAGLDGVQKAWDNFKSGFGGGGEGMFAGLGERARGAFDTVVGWLQSAWKWGKRIAALFGPDIRRIFDALGKAGKEVWEEIGPEVAKFGNTLKILGKALLNVGSIILPILVIAFKLVATIITTILWPVLKTVIQVVAEIIQAFRGLVDFVLGIFAGDISDALNGLKDLFFGIFGAIGQLLLGIGQVIVGVVWGFVKGIWELFVWLWDILVGNSVVPDMIDAIVATFELLVKVVKWLWNNVIQPIFKLFVKLWELVEGALKLWWKGVTTVWNALKAVGKWFWDNVLKPVFEWVQDLWSKYVKPAFALWWSGIKTVWNALKSLGQWVWDNILKPVYNWFKDLWSEYVRPALRLWWDGIKTVWNALKGLGLWIWNNVLKPVFDWFKSLWVDKVKPELLAWPDKIKNAWSNLVNLGQWLWNNALLPIKQKFIDIWHAIKDWFKENGDIIVTPIKSVVNKVIDAINAMIRGLNKIADVLPGIDWSINLIPKLAAGGDIPGQARRVMGGFKTNGARAIVGEGKANWPEYVIPTDPTYRNRARGLLSAAASKLGMQAGVPAHASGGILGSIKDAAGSVKDWGKGSLDWLGEKVDQLASLPFAPFKAAAGKLIDQINWKYGREAAQSVANQVFDWVTAADKVYEQGANKMMPIGGTVPVPDPSRPGTHSVWKGGTFTNRFIAHMQKAEELSGTAIQVMQGGFRPQTSYSGTSHQGDALDAQVNYALIRALRQVGIAAGDRTGLGNWDPHLHAVPGPSAGSAAGSAIWQFQDYMARGGMNQPLNSTWGLANGGIALARRGGVRATIAEGGQDEAVIPLPRNWRTDIIGRNRSDRDGDTIIEINGNLEFPNIKTGEDAEVLIANLKSLAGGAA